MKKVSQYFKYIHKVYHSPLLHIQSCLDAAIQIQENYKKIRMTTKCDTSYVRKEVLSST